MTSSIAAVNAMAGGPGPGQLHLCGRSAPSDGLSSAVVCTYSVVPENVSMAAVPDGTMVAAPG